jgi:hypothetical protein
LRRDLLRLWDWFNTDFEKNFAADLCTPNSKQDST